MLGNRRRMVRRELGMAAATQQSRLAPNHAENRLFVLRIMMYAGDRDELARVVFGD